MTSKEGGEDMLLNQQGGCPVHRAETPLVASPTRDTVKATSRLPETLAAAALVALALLTILRSQGFDGVIFGSDEYAYFARGLFPDALLRTTDPLLQEVSNHGYLTLVRLSNAGPARLQLIHLWGALIYGAGGVFTVLLARRFLDPLLSLVVGVLYFLLPTSGYVSSVMPEPVYAGVFALVAYLAVQRHGLRAPHALGAGLALGVLFSVKPHAIAVLLGTCAYAAVVAFAGAPSDGAQPPSLRRRVGHSASRVALVLAGFWAMAALVAGALGGAWSASPLSLVGGLYRGNVGGAVSGSFWAEALPAVLRYAGAHLTLMLMLFGVPAVVVAAAVRRVVRPPRGAEPSPGHLAPGLFALLVLAAAVAMVSIFTAQVGAVNPAEVDRLHVRYYSFVLPIVMLAGLAALRGGPSDRAVRSGGIVMLAGTVAFVLIASGFRLFPWDAADVFALFDRANPHWSFARAPSGFREAALAALFAAAVGVIVRPRAAVPALVAAWVVLLGLGNLSVYRWQREHVRAATPFYQEARAFSTLLRSRGLASGVVVGRERYGIVSPVLAGLANAPHVRVVTEEVLREDALPQGASWVLAVDAYTPEFAYESVLAGEALTLYLRGRGSPPLVVEGRAGPSLP